MGDPLGSPRAEIVSRPGVQAAFCLFRLFALIQGQRTRVEGQMSARVGLRDLLDSNRARTTWYSVLEYYE
jgi:hypothetical protein